MTSTGGNVNDENCLGYAARDSSGFLSPYKFSRRAVGSCDVSLRITHCGVCYADVSWTRNISGHSKYPLVPGHEIVGIVTEVGSTVQRFKVGECVGVGTYVNSCRDCEYCNDGLEVHCSKGCVYTFDGIDDDGTITKGGYSTHIVVHERVKNLFKVGALEWDEDIVKDLFEPRDRNLILSIPLSSQATKDNWYWAKESFGIYTVKSAYKLLQMVNGRWSGGDSLGFWRKFWNLKLPPKIKNFLWRAITNCLPTLTMLQSKQVNVDGICPVCRVARETILHALVHCSFARSCLAAGVGMMVITGVENFGDWYEAFCKVNDMDKIAKVSMVLWGVWKVRNEVVWNNKVSVMEGVVTSSITYLDQWLEAQKKGTLTPNDLALRANIVEKWTKPKSEEIKG